MDIMEVVQKSMRTTMETEEKKSSAVLDSHKHDNGEYTL